MINYKKTLFTLSSRALAKKEVKHEAVDLSPSARQLPVCKELRYNLILIHIRLIENGENVTLSCFYQGRGSGKDVGGGDGAQTEKW